MSDKPSPVESLDFQSSRKSLLIALQGLPESVHIVEDELGVIASPYFLSAQKQVCIVGHLE